MDIPTLYLSVQQERRYYNILTNSFHNTRIKLPVLPGDPEYADEMWTTLNARVYGNSHPERKDVRRLRRVWKKLCGIDGCQCGTYRP